MFYTTSDATSETVKLSRASVDLLEKSASVHVSADVWNMEMLSQKQNGSVGGLEEAEDGEQEDKKEHTATIKGLWKKAFKSLKSGDQKWLAKKSGSLKRRDSKEAEEVEPEEPKEIDPVYSLLKCAADLPKVSRSGCKDGGACSGPRDSSGSTSKASSPSSSGFQSSIPSSAPCPCCGATHVVDTPELGSAFKQFYKNTSPVKRASSADVSN
ncbi:hypothetical protein BaRGS_00031554 [Batillaria attramentaria]|uniref:Uncharacterized protein n=1 Tax=Batillaria attramentaria TaxID=370345 RepID=A0ABD0JQA5_9CAEN